MAKKVEAKVEAKSKGPAGKVYKNLAVAKACASLFLKSLGIEFKPVKKGAGFVLNKVGEAKAPAKKVAAKAPAKKVAAKKPKAAAADVSGLVAAAS